LSAVPNSSNISANEAHPAEARATGFCEEPFD
jgi:hypothetical protein